MSNIIDSLVKVTISISNGVDSAESFNNILIIDFSRTGISNGVEVYTSLSDIGTEWSTATTTDEDGNDVNEETELYKAARIAFDNGAEELYITSKAESEESIEDTLNRALGKSGWYGFFIVGLDESNYDTVGKWADDNNKLFGFTIDCSGGINSPFSDSFVTDGYGNYSIGFAVKDTETYPNNAYMAVAAMAKILTYQPGSETWAYKTLEDMTANEWTVAEINEIKPLSMNYYVTCAGKDILLDGKTISGEWIDVIRFRDWLINDIQTRIFNLYIKNAKIPYTDKGITLIENQIITSLKTGQSVGGVADTYYDDDGNEVPGYTVTMPKVANMSDANRASRTLSGCKFTARLAGAIHITEISGTLTT